MLSQLKLPAAPRKTVESELIPGEYIRWISQPVPRFFTGASIFTVIFAIPWTSFALFWTWGALGFKLPDLREGLRPEYMFAMFGIPFILIGLAMLSSPLWMWQAARKTVYLITDKRTIIIQGGWSNVIRVVMPDPDWANASGNLVSHYRSLQLDGALHYPLFRRCEGCLASVDRHK